MGQQPLTEALRETLEVFEDAAPLTTGEVASRVDIGRRSTYDRLERLVDRDRLRTKKVGASARVWWRPSDAVHWDTSESTSVELPAATAIHDIFDTADVAIFVVDEDQTVQWLSEPAERYFGLDRNSALHTDYRTVLHETLAPVVEDSAEFIDRMLDVYDDDAGGVEATCHVTAGDGREERWLSHSCRSIDSGTFDGRVHVYYDVSERKRTEDEHAQFQSLIDAVDEYAIFMLDPDGYIQTWNDGAERIKGYEESEAVGEHISLFYTEQDRAKNVPEENLAAAAQDGQVEDKGWRVRKDGSRFWADITLTAVHDDDGDLEGYVKVTRDMTARREYEQQLHEEKALIESLFDNQRDVLYAVDTDGEFLRWNDRLEEVSGYRAAQIAEMHPEQFIADGEAADLAATTETVFEDGESETVELALETVDGRTIPYEFTVSPLVDDSDEIVGLTGIGRDITDRKRKERQLELSRNELRNTLQEVFDRVDEAIFALDNEWRFTHTNDEAAAVLGENAGELLGQRLWEVAPDGLTAQLRPGFEEARETQEQVTFEATYGEVDDWFEFTAYPSDTGLSVYFQDITRRKERERDLERYETIVETVDDGIYVVDQDGYFTQVNEAYASMVDIPQEALVGTHVSEIITDEEVLERATQIEVELASGERTTATLEGEFASVSGERREGEATFALLWDGDSYERVGVVRDISERKARERELEQYERLVETVDDGVCALDGDDRFVLVNDAYVELTGYDRDELLGSDAAMLRDEELPPKAEEKLREIVAGDRDTASIELDLQTKAGDIVPCEARFAPFPFGDEHGRCGVVRDISERREYQQAIEERFHQQQVITDLGQRALEDSDIDGLLEMATEWVADTLGTDYCKVLELEDDEESLWLREGVGWDDGIVGSATVSATEGDSQAAYTLQTDQAVVVENLGTEERFSGPSLLTDHAVHSGISTIIGPADDPWGILGTHDTDEREFSDHEVNFVQSVANIIASAIGRHDDEQQLIHQRERLAALNSLNAGIRELTTAVIDQSTREEIEETVCEYLAASESYQFAWIGEPDPDSETIRLRAEAGVEGYLDDTVISLDPENPRSEGPTGRAFHTEEVQIAQRVSEDERFEPWQDHLDAYDFRASAAIPITHEGTVYGVLNVYTERARAFEDEELEVVSQLGTVVGHAIAAAERKQTLMSDDVVEMDFRIRNVFDILDIGEVSAGTITLDYTLPVSESEYLIYGTVTEDAVGTVHAITDAVPHWESVDVQDEGNPRRFELRLSEPPVLSVVASVGGYVESAVIEDGDYRMTIHASPGVNHRRIVDAVTEAYPSAKLFKHRQITRNIESAGRLQQALREDLTDRQQTILETAYHAGFFEWPRDISGEAVADSLGISSPTFHQHLRKAERKVFDEMLSNVSNAEM